MLFGQHFDGELPRNLNHVFLRQFQNCSNKKIVTFMFKNHRDRATSRAPKNATAPLKRKARSGIGHLHPSGSSKNDNTKYSESNCQKRLQNHSNNWNCKCKTGISTEDEEQIIGWTSCSQPSLFISVFEPSGEKNNQTPENSTLRYFNGNILLWPE